LIQKIGNLHFGRAVEPLGSAALFLPNASNCGTAVIGLANAMRHLKI
jgi:hypothetical protein